MTLYVAEFIGQALCQIERCSKTKTVLAFDGNKTVNSLCAWRKPVTRIEAKYLSCLRFGLAHRLP